jgi:hypothetical protein
MGKWRKLLISSESAPPMVEHSHRRQIHGKEPFSLFIAKYHNLIAVEKMLDSYEIHDGINEALDSY